MSRKFFRVSADFSTSRLNHWIKMDFQRSPASIAGAQRLHPRATQMCLSMSWIRDDCAVSIRQTQAVESLPGAPRQWDLPALQTDPANRKEELRGARWSVRLDYFR